MQAMDNSRMAVYLVGLVVIVGAVWVFLTQTEIGQTVPQGIALALILLLVGIGVMASVSNIRGSRTTRRVVHDADGAPRDRYIDHPVHEEHIIDEERR